ncbi:MAG TPA: heavy-metal-associated domain-containing protein [Longimicrobiales bacterium]|nr:heavy-metal-associated domain-containing protein [Longimicrobiales bacterium]
MTTILRSDEFTCPSCVDGIESALTRLAGVRAATVHFGTGRIEVEHDPGIATASDLVMRVKEAGYTARVSPF